MELLLFCYTDSLVTLYWIEDIIIWCWYYDNLSAAQAGIHTLDIVVNVSTQCARNIISV